MGLLRAPALDEAGIALVADLGQIEEHRLPPRRSITIMGCEAELVLQVPNDHFTAALMLYLQQGRQA